MDSSKYPVKKKSNKNTHSREDYTVGKDTSPVSSAIKIDMWKALQSVSQQTKIDMWKALQSVSQQQKKALREAMKIDMSKVLQSVSQQIKIDMSNVLKNAQLASLNSDYLKTAKPYVSALDSNRLATTPLRNQLRTSIGFYSKKQSSRSKFPAIQYNYADVQNIPVFP